MIGFALRKRFDTRGVVVSVVLTGREQDTYLELTLACLGRQRFPGQLWEIVAIADERDLERTRLLERMRGDGLPLRWLESAARRSRGQLLNEALESAAGKVIVLVGENQLVGSDFLLRHLLIHAQGPCVVVGDHHRRVHTHLLPPSDPSVELAGAESCVDAGKLRRLEDLAGLVTDEGPNHGPVLECYARQGRPNRTAWACFSAANASFPREAVLAMGGFDERFGDSPLADREFALRLHRAGLPLRFESRAWSLEQVRQARAPATGAAARSVAYFLARHPELSAIEKELVSRDPVLGRA